MTMYRYPHITGTTDSQQLHQLKTYLYQLVEQLNNADSAAAQVLVTAPAATGGRKEKTAADFAAMKALIIKSADIVDAYCEKIGGKLSGVYVSQSEYGTFTRQTENAITANATAISQNYRDVQNLITDLQTRQQETSGYIRTGLLYYAGTEDPLPEGTPVYGVEVGQQIEGAFQRFGRFTAYGMTFYDENGIAAAQISQGQLQIFRAKITEGLTLGGFCDQVLPDGTVVTRWQGV